LTNWQPLGERERALVRSSAIRWIGYRDALSVVEA
jgi:hypothetical protein